MALFDEYVRNIMGIEIETAQTCYKDVYNQKFRSATEVSIKSNLQPPDTV
jgi:hypothetical protein